MKLKEFLKKWCIPFTTDESVIMQFNEDLQKLVLPYEFAGYECEKHKSDLPCEECQRENEQDYEEMKAQQEEEDKAKQMAQEQEEYERERHQEYNETTAQFLKR